LTVVDTENGHERDYEPFVLVCQECGKEADVNAHGWRAYLTDDEEDSRPVFYCAVCAEREFGSD
jgi:hypothetical protein